MSSVMFTRKISFLMFRHALEMRQDVTCVYQTVMPREQDLNDVSQFPGISCRSICLLLFDACKHMYVHMCEL